MSELGKRSIEADVRRLRVLLTAGGHIYKTKVSSDDTTPGFLSDKITSADSSVVVTVLNDGADEDLDLSVTAYVTDVLADHTADPDAHHNQVHVLATTAGLGADHTVSGLTSGQVLRATGATTAAFANLQATDLPSHVLATNTALGSQHTISGATAGHVLRASSATAAAFAQLQHSDLGGVSANQHHNQSHVLATTTALGPDHTVSGLTSGQVLKATSSTAARFVQLLHSELGSIGANDHHNRQHSITSSSDHTVTGAALDVVGLSATNTLGILTPDADPTAAALLRSDTDGRLGLEGLGILTAPDGDYLKVASGVAVGLANSAAGRFVFTDDTVDQVALLDAVYLVGSNTPDANTGAIVQVIDGNFAVSANGASGGINSFVYSSTADHIPTFRGRKSLGTRSSPTAVGSGTVLARFGGAGWNGSAFPTESTAYIEMRSTQTHSGSAAGSHIRFGVTPDDSTTAVEVARLEGAGRLLIAETSNAHQTIGVTINMATNTNEIATFKQSNVAHGMTSLTDTNVFGAISIRSGTQGGMVMSGYHEGTTGVEINGAGVTDLTGKAAASEAYIHLNALKKSGSGVTTPGTGANLVAIRKNGSSVAIFAEDGDLYLDTVVNTDSWDAHNDMELLNGLRAAMVPDGHELRRRFGQFVAGARAVLESTGVVTFNEDGHLFVASKKLQMLTIDALRQKHERDTELIGQLTRRIEQLEMVVNG